MIMIVTRFLRQEEENQYRSQWDRRNVLSKLHTALELRQRCSSGLRFFAESVFPSHKRFSLSLLNKAL